MISRPWAWRDTWTVHSEKTSSKNLPLTQSILRTSAGMSSAIRDYPETALEEIEGIEGQRQVGGLVVSKTPPSGFQWNVALSQSGRLVETA
jgi:hypothetical protein